jgi:phage N-6-adenine-methyltransferase
MISMTLGVHASSASDEWETPRLLFQQLQDWYGEFTLDPCCTVENAKAATFFTAAEDGLAQPWKGHNVFMNPPYGRKIGKWVEKAYTESRSDYCRVVALIPSRTDTSYWHDFVLRAAQILFIRNRLYFNDGVGRAPFPSAVVLFDNAARHPFSPMVGTFLPRPASSVDRASAS